MSDLALSSENRTMLPINTPLSTYSAGRSEEPASINSDDDRKEERWIWVLDPMTRKLRVPFPFLIPTQATATSGTVPSLCIAYLEGRCRHPWCRQAHVLPSAIPQLRFEALNAPTCCRVHHDPHDISILTKRFRYIRITNNGSNGNSELIATDRVASTVGLLRYLVHSAPQKKSTNDSVKEAHGPGDSAVEDLQVLDLPAKFICRLHLAHRCRYLEDCNNIHLCREYELRLHPPPHMLSVLSTVLATMCTVSIGDTCYRVTPLAVGDISDEDFKVINEAQRINHRHMSSASSTLRWGGTNTPYDCSVVSNAANSPLVYPCAPNTSPLLQGVGTSSAIFPSTPDCWQGGSPGGMMGAAGSRHLRIYDVRPKTHNSSSLGLRQATEHAAGPAVDSREFATSTTQACIVASAQNGSAVPTKSGRDMTYVSSSGDGGVSVSSGTNTPPTDSALGSIGTQAVYGEAKERRNPANR